MNRRGVSLHFNEYIRETAVMVATNMAVIKFSLIQFYILCFSPQGTFSKRIETARELRLVTKTQTELQNCEIAFGGTYSNKKK